MGICPDWITAIGTVVLAAGTIVLAIIAIFQDKIRAWLMRPNLTIGIELAPPDCHKTILEKRDYTGKVLDSFWCYYFRLRILI